MKWHKEQVLGERVSADEAKKQTQIRWDLV